MELEDSLLVRASAEQEFTAAKRRAFIEGVLGQLRGQPTSLLPFEAVKARLGLLPSGDRGIQEIPLDKIVGSEGRYHQFTRSFSPSAEVDKERWMRVFAASESGAGLPPIEVYKVGDVYFVKDGNHRVSVARQVGAKTILAYVTEFVGPVDLSADMDLAQISLEAERARFLQQTELDELRPDSNLDVTNPAYYQKLEEHIAVHGYFLGLERRRDINWEEAVTDWYDTVYMPMVAVIRSYGLQREFPGQTEADLYLWIMDHRYFLAQDLGQDIELQEAAEHFVQTRSPRFQRAVGRVRRSVADLLVPTIMESGPPVGLWREERVEARPHGNLFQDIMVLLSDDPDDWCAVEQTVVVARYEQAKLYGVHLTSASAQETASERLRARFAQECEHEKIDCRFIVEHDPPSEALVQRARWVDLVVLPRFDLGQSTLAAEGQRLLRTALRHVSCPLLYSGLTCSSLRSALLAYDASPTSEEALRVAALLAKSWQMKLAVVTVGEARRAGEVTLDKAVTYLREHGVEVQAEFVQGPVSEQIVGVADRIGCDLLIMGGAGYSPFRHLFSRRTIDRVLRDGPYPVLICR